MNKRRNYSAAFKAKVALDAIRGELTLPELSSKYDVNPKIISKWKVEAVKTFKACLKDEFRQQRKKINQKQPLSNLFEFLGPA